MSDAAVITDGPQGPFCNGNGECTTAGECCITFGGPGICGPGVIIFGACLPQ